MTTNEEDNELMKEAIKKIKKVIDQYVAGCITEPECLDKIVVLAYDWEAQV